MTSAPPWARCRGGAFPRLPATTRELERAEQQVEHFSLPAIPGQKQSFPHQGHGHRPVRNTAAATTVTGV